MKEKIIGWLLDLFIKNWQTTATGIGGAALTRIPALKPYSVEILALTTAIMGILAKVATQSGTVEQPRTDALVVKSQNLMVTKALGAIKEAEPVPVYAWEKELEEQRLKELREGGG